MVLVIKIDVLNDVRKTILVFGSISAIILLLFQIESWSLMSAGRSENHFLILTGILFLIMGVLISRYVYIDRKRRKKIKAITVLSDQELKVLGLIEDGLSNREIAEQLFISETTVKSHVSNILAKLDARRRTEAVKIARELNIL